MSEISVRIDRDECIVDGVCWETCPEVFEESPDDELSQIVAKYRVNDDPGLGKVPEELEDCVTEAADVCPVYIIHVEKG
jgi:ferredoxin